MLSSPQCGAGDGGCIRLTKGDVCHSSDFIVTESYGKVVMSPAERSVRADEPPLGVSLSDCPPSDTSVRLF